MAKIFITLCLRRPQLTDQQIADVLTYVRNSFGNKASIVTPAEVKAFRAKTKYMKKILFIDRDGTLIKEYPPTYQIDSLEKLEFYPYVFNYMHKIAEELDYELVMVSNQDGLGTDKFPEEDFLPIHKQILTSFENEGVHF